MIMSVLLAVKVTPANKSNPDPTGKQLNDYFCNSKHSLNIVACPTYPEKFIRHDISAPFLLLFVVIVP